MKKLFSAICALVLIFGASISGVFTASCSGLPGSSGLSGSGSSSGNPSASGGSGVAGERLINSVVLVNFAGEESFDEEKKANVKSVFSEGENSLGSYVSFISLGRTSVVTEIVGEVTLGFSADYFTPAYAYSTDDAAYVRINENGYVMVFLDDTVLVRRSPDMKGDSFPDSRLDRILEFLSQVVANTVGMLQQGVYNDYVKKGLPYENRKGFINRALYWKLVPKSKRHDRDGLKEKEIDKLVAHIKAGNDLFATKAAGRYERMSSGKYYEVCSYCYAAASYKELDGKTPKEMFKRYGDDRDGGMSLLDENSQDDFDKWFKLSTQEKWKIENPSHMWEISCGHTHTMIHLYLFWDDGYWFYLSGGTHCLTTEVVRMYNAMKDKGVPVLLGHAGQIVDKLLGNDDLGIIPNNDMGWRYWYGGFPKDNVINFVQLSDGNADAVIKNATWFDIDDVKLADK